MQRYDTRNNINSLFTDQGDHINALHSSLDIFWY